MLMLLVFLIAPYMAQAQVDVQKPNYLLKNILGASYNVEVVTDSSSSAYMFIPKDLKKNQKLKQMREGTLLTNNPDDLEESDVIIQSWSKAGDFEFYTAQKQAKDWKMYRYTDGNHNSKNLTFCETEKQTEGLLDFRTPIYCVFASERICKKPLSQWPKKNKLSRKEFSQFFGEDLEHGFKEYVNFSNGQMTSLRDRMSNIYKIDNFKKVNRMEKAYKKDDGFAGDAMRGAVVSQVKGLCKKAWPQYSEPVRRAQDGQRRRSAPRLQNVNTGTK